MEHIPETEYRKLASVAEQRDAPQPASENHNQMRHNHGISTFASMAQSESALPLFE